MRVRVRPYLWFLDREDTRSWVAAKRPQSNASSAKSQDERCRHPLNASCFPSAGPKPRAPEFRSSRTKKGAPCIENARSLRAGQRIRGVHARCRRCRVLYILRVSVDHLARTPKIVPGSTVRIDRAELHAGWPTRRGRRFVRTVRRRRVKRSWLAISRLALPTNPASRVMPRGPKSRRGCHAGMHMRRGRS